MKTYAELYGNMQKGWIKSRPGNNLIPSAPTLLDNLANTIGGIKEMTKDSISGISALGEVATALRDLTVDSPLTRFTLDCADLGACPSGG